MNESQRQAWLALTAFASGDHISAAQHANASAMHAARDEMYRKAISGRDAPTPESRHRDADLLGRINPGHPRGWTGLGGGLAHCWSCGSMVDGGCGEAQQRAMSDYLGGAPVNCRTPDPVPDVVHGDTGADDDR